MAQHIYEWAKGRGYWLRNGEDRPGQPTSHLLLDGGRLAVPPESHGALLNAYASSILAHRDRPPCMVELRTPVFRMFMDLDTRFAGAAAAASAAALQGPLADALRAVAAAACPGQPAIVCGASGVKREARDGAAPTYKMGFHLVWPEALVTGRTALALRERALEALRASDALRDPEALGLVGRWEDILDAVVFRSSGLRMAWSAKGRHDARVYVPLGRILADGQLAPLGLLSGVAALRDMVRALSIRSFALEPTVQAGDEEEDLGGGCGGASGGGGGSYAHKSLAAYSDVLAALAASLPPEFAGQRFACLLAGETCFLLRSTSRYCLNAGREHSTSNVYFVLTRRGVCQRCYCRKDTGEGRAYGACKDFSSEVWPVAPEVLAAFFPDPAPDQRSTASTSTAPPALGAMPSRAAKSLDFDSLVRRSHMAPPPKPKRAKKPPKPT